MCVCVCVVCTPFAVSGDSYEEKEEEEEDELDCLAPTPKRCKLARERALTASLLSGLYPTFGGIQGPFQDIPPDENNALEYLLYHLPTSLCELIAVETNRYAQQRGVASWQQTRTS